MAYAARSTGDEGAAREASRLAKKAPKMLPFREEVGSVSVPGDRGACSRSRMSPWRGVGGGVLHGDLQALHGRAESLARGTAEEECGDVGVEGEVQDEDLLVGLESASSQAVWKAMKVFDAASVVAEAHGVRGGHGRGRGEGVQEKMRPKRGRAFSGEVRRGRTRRRSRALTGRWRAGCAGGGFGR